MSDQDVRALARRIHDMEEKLAALSRSRQLTSSSVPITVDGDDGPEVIDVPLATGVSQGVQAGADARDALVQAGEAVESAASANATADGKNANFRGPTQPAGTHSRPIAINDQWWVEDAQGRPVGLRVFTAFGWIPKTFEADSILVPGSMGAVSIKDGAVTAGKIAAAAIDGMVITGARIRTSPTGQRMEFDAAGLVSYNQSGTLTSRISASSGGMELTGQLKTRYAGDPRSTLIDPASISLYSNIDVHAENRRAFVRSGSLEFQYGDMAGPRHYRTSLDFLGLDLQYRPAQGRPWIHAGISVAGSNSRQHSEMFADQAIFERVEAGVIHPHRSGTSITFEGPTKFQGDTDWVRLDGWTGGFTHSSSPVQYRIINNTVEFRGSLSNSSWSGALAQFNTLPPRIQPLVPFHQFPVAMNSNVVRTIYPRSDGAVYLYGSGVSGSVWSFDAVSWAIAPA